jgi:hypothetical protein
MEPPNQSNQLVAWVPETELLKEGDLLTTSGILATCFELHHVQEVIHTNQLKNTQHHRFSLPIYFKSDEKKLYDKNMRGKLKASSAADSAAASRFHRLTDYYAGRYEGRIDPGDG